MEQTVRLRLSQKSGSELKAYVDAQPEIKTEFEKLSETYTNKIRENVEQSKKDIIEIFRKAGDEFSDEDVEEFDEMIQNITTPFMGFFKSEFSLDELLKPSLSKDAGTMEQEWLGCYEKLVRNCQDNGLQTASLITIDVQMRQAIEQMRIYDIEIARLTDIAKEKGIETAMQDSVQYEVIRELFPTKEIYSKHIEEMRAIKKAVVLTAGAAISNMITDSIVADVKADNKLDDESSKLIGVMSKAVGSIIKGVFDNIDIYSNLMTKVARGMAEKDINIIYNSAK